MMAGLMQGVLATGSVCTGSVCTSFTNERFDTVVYLSTDTPVP